jgi:hypothetical protein
MCLYKNIKNIKTKEDFINFINLLIKDFEEKPDEWENVTVENYLEAMSSWVEDMEGYYINNNLPMPEKIDWNFFANVLYAAKLYE